MNKNCITCRFVCYDVGLGNGYCNNKSSDYYSKCQVNDKGCKITNCDDYIDDGDNRKWNRN